MLIYVNLSTEWSHYQFALQQYTFCFCYTLTNGAKSISNRNTSKGQTRKSRISVLTITNNDDPLPFNNANIFIMWQMIGKEVDYSN